MTTIEYGKNGVFAFVTLNRPDKRNALNHEMVSDLREAFAELEQDQAVKVIVLKSSGRSFCAGADLEYLKELQDFTLEENLADSSFLRDLFLQIYTLDKIVIAQVQGHALAGGCGLANVCDFVFTVPEAKFGYTEVKIGFIPALVMVFLLRKLGEGPVREMLLTGDLITADHALKLGLVNRVVAPELLEVSVDTFAASLVKSNSFQAMIETKRMISKVQSLPLEQALDYAVKKNAEARRTTDCKNGINAFLNKTEVTW
ncbi:MAG: enoyl-CoA hydratase-related protein [Chryseolinea sp.]